MDTGSQFFEENSSFSVDFFLEKSFHLSNLELSQSVNVSDANENVKHETALESNHFLMPSDEPPFELPIKLYFGISANENKSRKTTAQPNHSAGDFIHYKASRTEPDARKKIKLSKGKRHDLSPKPQENFHFEPLSPFEPADFKNVIELRNRDDFHRFSVFVPLFNKTDKNNFPDLLAQFLCQYLHLIPLADFYKLLYTSSEATMEYFPAVNGAGLIEEDDNGPKRDAFVLCRLILETFKLPNVFCSSEFGQYTKLIELPSLNMHEVFRVFLSIKIVMDAVNLVDDKTKPDSCLSRASIHKTYYILCKKLIQNNTISSNISDLQKNIVLNQSQFGRVLRSVFPSHKAKRLGKRGDSKFHYQGMAWNTNFVDEDTRYSATLSFDDINTRLGQIEEKRSSIPRPLLTNLVSTEKLDENSVSTSKARFTKTMLKTTKPLYSFVDISHTFANPEFSLRVWEYTPGKIPQQSQWSRNAMNKSVDLLKNHSIIVEPLLLKVQNELFSANSVHWFLEEISAMIFSLMEANDEAYLHLYLIVSLFLFPISYASENERTCISRDQLSHSLSSFVAGIESNSCKFSLQVQSDGMALSKIVRKMINSIKLLLSRVPTSLSRRVLEVLADYPGPQSNDSQKDSTELKTMNILQRAVVTACHALNWEFLGKLSASDPEYQANFVSEITERYMRFCIKLDSFADTPAPLRHGNFNELAYELPFRLFMELTRLFHDLFLSDPMILRLPVKLLELMINSVVNETQTAAFLSLGNMDSELSKEVYKTWWVYATVVQEHMSIISEVVALSEIVLRENKQSSTSEVDARTFGKA